MSQQILLIMFIIIVNPNKKEAIHMENQQYIELDVREDLEQKNDPFDKIMGTLKELKDGQGLILHAIFNPAPLHKVMERKGFDNKVEAN